MKYVQTFESFDPEQEILEGTGNKFLTAIGFVIPFNKLDADEKKAGLHNIEKDKAKKALYDSFEDKNKKEALVAYFFSHPNLRAPEAHWNEKKKSFEAVDPRYGKGFVGSN